MTKFPAKSVCALLLLVALADLRAQSVVRTLGAPTATFAEPFSLVSAVREQSDGRVVVLDEQEIRILRIDFRDGGAVEELGRSGRGPGEYTVPVVLIALPGDTTLVVDQAGGGRHLVITRDGVSRATLRSAGIERTAPLFFSPSIQADADGRLYELVTRVRESGGRLMRTDSSGVRRLDRSSGRVDTIGQISRLVRSPLSEARSRSAGQSQGPERSTGAMPPFSSVDQWAVAPDGRIAVVSVDPYRVTYVSATAERVEAAPIRFTSVALTEAHKVEWRQVKQRPTSTIFFGPNGALSAGRTKRRYSEPVEWPEVLPPFLTDAVRFAPDGRLWVERTTESGAPQTFDLIDRESRVASRVELPAGTRLVGFGARSVYLVRIGQDDLEYLQRYDLPATER